MNNALTVALFHLGRGSRKWPLACYFLACQFHLEVPLTEKTKQRLTQENFDGLYLYNIQMCLHICMLSLLPDFPNSDETVNVKEF